MLRPTAALLVVIALLLAGCGSDGGAGDGTSSGTSDRSNANDQTSEGFGEAAEPDEAQRSVEVVALDELKFDPPTIEVASGETVTFVVTNEGKAPHEFVIGDHEYQEEHERAMGHGGHGASIGNVVELEPGETAELTWTFSDPGEVLYACHVSGHYAGGMVGTISVEEV